MNSARDLLEKKKKLFSSCTGPTVHILKKKKCQNADTGLYQLYPNGYYIEWRKRKLEQLERKETKKRNILLNLSTQKSSS